MKTRQLYRWNRLRRGQIAATAVAVLSLSTPVFATSLSVGDFGQLALRCGPSVAPSTLASIARTESSFEPWTINDNTAHTSGVPASRDIALQLAAKLIEAGHSVDVGIMQINSGNFQRLGLTADAALDPCKSIAAAAAILAGDFSAGDDTHEGQQAALRVAISKYNTGDAQRGFDNGYVQKVELAARRVVPAIDVGATPAAIDSTTPHAQSVPAVPPDPNAPPSWDVWAAYDYAASHRPGSQVPAPSGAAPVKAALSTADNGPSAVVPADSPESER